VLLVVALGGGGNDTTVTRERTVTVVSNTLTNGGTVITSTAVPDLVGQRLDVACHIRGMPGRDELSLHSKIPPVNSRA